MGESPKKDRVAQKVAASVSSSSLHDLKDAIESLGMSTTDEQETLQEIHKELKDYDEDVRELEEIKNQVDRFDLKQSKGARLLLKILIAKERRIQNQMKKTIKTDDANLQEDHEEKIVTIQDLIEAVTRRQETPNQEKVDQIAQVLAMMDADHDGIIKVDEVLKVIELLGEESTEWHAKQIKQIVKMLGEEEKIKVEDSIEDILLKHPQLFDEDDEAFQQDLKALEDLATSDNKGSLEDYVISKEAVKKLDETSHKININSTDDEDPHAKTSSEEFKDENTEVLIDQAEILLDKAKEFEPTPTFPDEDDKPSPASGPHNHSGPVRLDPVSKPKSQPRPTSTPTSTSPTNDTSHSHSASPNSTITDENKKQLQENGGKGH
jgi:Ca2+-binding EF-hand superfamily protein